MSKSDTHFAKGVFIKKRRKEIIVFGTLESMVYTDTGKIMKYVPFPAPVSIISYILMCCQLGLFRIF